MRVRLPSPVRSINATWSGRFDGRILIRFLTRFDPEMWYVKLWIDDIRLPPDGWQWAKTSTDAIIALNSGLFDEVSFDHDLGGDDTTRPVVLHLAEYGGWPEICRVHTANPVGRIYLEGVISRYGPGVTN